MEKLKKIETGNSEKLDFDFEKLWEIGFKDFNLDLFDNIIKNSVQKREKVSVVKEKKIDLSSVNIDIDYLFNDLEIDISSSSENKTNLRREEILKKEVTNTLINCLVEEDFEFGYKVRSEQIIREQFSINALATRNWLNEIFIENFHNEKVLIGILRIIGRFDEEIIFPQGQTMALAALVHENNEIKELGIRAFENWNSVNSLQILKKVKAESKWLQDYLNQVIEYLNEELCLY